MTESGFSLDAGASVAAKRRSPGARYALSDLARLPNLVSLARLPLAVAFPFCVSRPAVAVAVLVVAGGTDVLDGWLARRRGETTPLGALLDPIADKIFVAVVIITLVVERLIPAWAALLLVTREMGQSALLVGRIAARRAKWAHEHPPPANLAGKLTTALQFAGVVTALLIGSWFAPLFVSTAIVGAAAAFAYWRSERGPVAQKPLPP
jgi:CDP-diacylglycerol--glycerol-3-phosphate 3-phosphatidyltransferase